MAIKRNSEALKGIVAALFAMLGLDGEAMVGRIPRSLHRAVLRVLRPAESAVRRLIIIAARGLVVKPARLRFASDAGGADRQGRERGPVPPSSSSIRGKTSPNWPAPPEGPAGYPRASLSSTAIPR